MSGQHEERDKPVYSHNELSAYNTVIRGENHLLRDYLLSGGVQLDLQTERKKSLLMWAVDYDRVACARTLIELGADVEAMDTPNRDPLLHACYRGNIECVNLLLRAGAYCCGKQTNISPLRIACYRGHVECVQALIEAGANPYSDVDVDFASRMHPFRGYSGYSIGYSKGVIGDAVLGHADCVKLLLSIGADLEGCMARSRAKIPCLSLACSVDLEPDSTLHPYGCEFLECVRQLIRAGAEIDKTSESGQFIRGGQTALHFAAESGFLEGAWLLLNAGADQYIKDNEGRTPMDADDDDYAWPYAKEIAQTRQMIAQYIREGQRPNRLLTWRRAVEAKRDAGMVFRAARDGRPLELGKRLRLGKLAGGLEISGNTVSGEVVTPLQASMLGGHWDCVRLLQGCGAELPVGEI